MEITSYMVLYLEKMLACNSLKLCNCSKSLRTNTCNGCKAVLITGHLRHAALTGPVNTIILLYVEEWLCADSQPTVQVKWSHLRIHQQCTCVCLTRPRNNPQKSRLNNFHIPTQLVNVNIWWNVCLAVLWFVTSSHNVIATHTHQLS